MWIKNKVRMHFIGYREKDPMPFSEDLLAMDYVYGAVHDYQTLCDRNDRAAWNHVILAIGKKTILRASLRLNKFIF